MVHYQELMLRAHSNFQDWNHCFHQMIYHRIRCHLKGNQHRIRQNPWYHQNQENINNPIISRFYPFVRILASMISIVAHSLVSVQKCPEMDRLFGCSTFLAFVLDRRNFTYDIKLFDCNGRFLSILS